MYKVKSLILLAVALLFFLVLPLVYMSIGDYLVPDIGRATFTFYQYLSQPSTGTVLENTLVFSLASSAITVVLSLTYAWIVARINVPGRRALLLLPILGIAMPDVIKAIGWTYLFNPNAGLVNVAIESILKTRKPIFDLYSMGGLVFVRAVSNVPLSYLIIYPAIMSLDPSLDEASRIAGHGYLRSLLQVNIPLIRPAIVISFVLAVIGGINNFDYPFIIGGPARIQVLATQLYFYVETRIPSSYGDAAFIGIFFAIISTIGVTIYIWLTRDRFRFQVVTGRSRVHAFQNVGNWKYVAFLICIVIIGMEFIIPFGTLLLISMTSIYVTGIGSVHLDFPKYYIEAIKFPLLFNSLTLTLEVGFLAGLAATAISVLLAYAETRTGSWQSRFVQYVTSIPLAVPGIVYGVALLWTFLLAPGFHTLYGTAWPLVIVLIFVEIPFTMRIISGNFIQLSNELEDASQISGASFWKALRRILTPLIKVGILNCFMFSFVDSMSNLGAVVLVSTGKAIPFTVYLLQLYTGVVILGGFSTPIVAAASVMFVCIIAAILVIISVIAHFWGRSNLR